LYGSDSLLELTCTSPEIERANERARERVRERVRVRERERERERERALARVRERTIANESVRDGVLADSVPPPRPTSTQPRPTALPPLSSRYAPPLCFAFEKMLGVKCAWSVYVSLKSFKSRRSFISSPLWTP